MKQTEGQHLTLRWAKALKTIAEKMTVYIDDHQLIVGRSGKQGRYGILYPELDGDFLDLAIEQLSQRVQSPFDIAAEDVQVVIDEIAPYWKGKTYHEALAVALPEETARRTFDPKDPLLSRFIVNETSSFRSSSSGCTTTKRCLKKGFKRMKEDAEERLQALDPFSPTDNVEKKPFLEAIVTLCDAIVIWAKRHSRLAADMAAKEKDPQRKAELLEIARICNKVPEHPAETFHEAVQSQWFVQMFSRIEQKTGTIISNGRMDQYFYPYLQEGQGRGPAHR